MGSSQFPTPDPMKLIAELQERMTKAEEAITALQSAPARPVAALGFSGVVPVPMPESEIPAATERVLAEMRTQGWEQPEARIDCVASISDALRYGIPEDTLKAHFGALILKLGSVADQNIGHGGLRLIDESLYPLLLDGRGIGYSIWLTNDAEFKAVFGYTLAELVAMEKPGQFITDPRLYAATNGAQGWRPRANDPRGTSSDDRLFGEPKP